MLIYVYYIFFRCSYDASPPQGAPETLQKPNLRTSLKIAGMLPWPLHWEPFSKEVCFHWFRPIVLWHPGGKRHGCNLLMVPLSDLLVLNACVHRSRPMFLPKPSHCSMVPPITLSISAQLCMHWLIVALLQGCIFTRDLAPLKLRMYAFLHGT